jgi:hypothetical protein
MLHCTMTIKRKEQAANRVIFQGKYEWICDTAKTAHFAFSGVELLFRLEYGVKK